MSECKGTWNLDRKDLLSTKTVVLNDGKPEDNSQVCVHEKEKEEPDEVTILSAVGQLGR